MAVKDHSTGLTHITSLPRYTSIFHIDNGLEFLAKVIREILKA